MPTYALKITYAVVRRLDFRVHSCATRSWQISSKYCVFYQNNRYFLMLDYSRCNHYAAASNFKGKINKNDLTICR